MECCIIPSATAKSLVWVHFGFPGNADGTIMTKKRAICRISSQEMSYKNHTSNLFSHLERHHRDEYAKLRKTKSSQSTSKEVRQPSIFANLANAVPLGASSTRHKQLVDAVGTFVIQDSGNLKSGEQEILSPETVDHLLFLYENMRH